MESILRALLGSDAPQERSPSVLTVALALSLANVVGIVWFFTMLGPDWRAVLNSDHAIPYIMTLEPWHLQDFYYWNQERFGSLFVVLWKAIVAPLAGPSALPFYLTHSLLFWNGLALWLLALRGWLSRALFAWFMLPTSEGFAEVYLLAGNPYGMVFLLMGAFWLVLLRRGRVHSGWLLGGLCGLLYWIHEPAALMLLGVAAVDGLRIPTRRPEWRVLVSLAIAFAPMLIFSHVAKTWARRWPVQDLGGLEAVPAIVSNLLDFAERGLPMGDAVPHGHLLALGLLVALALSVRSSWRGIRNADAGHGLERSESLRVAVLSAAFLGASVLAVLLLNTSEWYTTNLRAWRYYAFLGPPIFFLLLTQLESPEYAPPLRWSLLALVVAIAASSRLGSPQPWTLDADWRMRAVARMERRETRIAALLANECPGWIGRYWESYVLTPISNGRVRASAVEFSRNPELLEDILTADTFCASPELMRRKHAWETLHSRCTRERGLLECRGFERDELSR